MTVAELIKELQEYDPDTVVVGDMATGNLLLGEDGELGEIEVG